jgi:hypothetical protein
MNLGLMVEPRGSSRFEGKGSHWVLSGLVFLTHLTAGWAQQDLSNGNRIQRLAAVINRSISKDTIEKITQCAEGEFKTGIISRGFRNPTVPDVVIYSPEGWWIRCNARQKGIRLFGNHGEPPPDYIWTTYTAYIPFGNFQQQNFELKWNALIDNGSPTPSAVGNSDAAAAFKKAKDLTNPPPDDKRIRRRLDPKIQAVVVPDASRMIDELLAQ